MTEQKWVSVRTITGDLTNSDVHLRSLTIAGEQ